jgi:glyoxylase-like metal-dependent hydrolase (beta-lactamase superfamily II)
MRAMEELLPGIFTWRWYSERHGYDFNGWFVRHDGGNLCIDPVECSPQVLDALSAASVARVVLTNRNHFRDAARVRERTGARVAVHPADAAFVRAKGVTVDEPLEPGQAIGPFVVVGAPGKSPGEVALHWPARRLLLVGDACVGKPAGSCSLLPPAVIDDLPGLRASLGALARLDFDTLLLCDGPPILQGGRAALSRLVDSFASGD